MFLKATHIFLIEFLCPLCFMPGNIENIFFTLTFGEQTVIAVAVISRGFHGNRKTLDTQIRVKIENVLLTI